MKLITWNVVLGLLVDVVYNDVMSRGVNHPLVLKEEDVTMDVALHTEYKPIK